MNDGPADVEDPTEVRSPAAGSRRGSLLVRNFGVLMSSQLATWGLSMAATIVIPRYLGAELLGRLHIANSLWAIGFVVASFGMNLLITKEVARDPSRLGPLLATSITLRLLLSVPVALLLFVYARLAGYADQTIAVLAIIGAATLGLSVTASIASILQGLERMGAMSLATVVGRVVFVGGSLALLAAGYGIIAVAVVTAAGNFVSLALHVWALRDVRRELGDHSRMSVDTAALVDLLRRSAPYFGLSFFIVLYLQVDAIVISLVVESEEVLGWYSIYDKLAGTLMFVPTVFMTVMYPSLSRLFSDSPDGHNRLTRKSYELMLLISIPLGLGLAAIARPLVELMFGADFEEAAAVMAVGGIVTSLTYLTTVLGMFLISMDRQREWTRIIAFGALLTIPLDIVLVPLFQTHFDNGAIGGAVAYLITEGLVLAGAIYLLPTGALGPGSTAFTARVVAAGVVMVGVIYPLRELVLPVQVATGALSYGVMVAVLRLVSAEDRELLRSYLPGALGRERT